MSEASSSSNQAAGRPRSVPYRAPFWFAIFLTMLHFVALAAFVAAMAWMLKRPEEKQCALAASCAGAVVITWLMAFFARRNANCPLCRGTPYLNSGAHPHPEAQRWGMLNHGITAVLSTAIRGRFVCMYCGNLYSLLKKPAHLRTSKPCSHDACDG